MHELDPLDPLTETDRSQQISAIAKTVVAIAVGVGLTCLVVLARLNTLSHLA